MVCLVGLALDFLVVVGEVGGGVVLQRDFGHFRTVV